MDLHNPVIKLCIEGTRAEFEGNIKRAHVLYKQAWDLRKDDYDACIAAHYVARHPSSPEETFCWNQEALTRANMVNDERVDHFYPSLYLNLGYSYELLGNQAEAQRYYDLAAQLGVMHQDE